MRTAADFLENDANLVSLMERGFGIGDLDQDGVPELYAANGEVHLVTRDAVEYILPVSGASPASITVTRAALEEPLYACHCRGG